MHSYGLFSAATPNTLSPYSAAQISAFNKFPVAAGSGMSPYYGAGTFANATEQFMFPLLPSVSSGAGASNDHHQQVASAERAAENPTSSQKRQREKKLKAKKLAAAAQKDRERYISEFCKRLESSLQ